MKKIMIACLIFSMIIVLANVKDSNIMKIKGFYLGMTREQVKEIYQQYKKDKVAEYISIETENYRDLIKLDNEFSSMGNILEISYDESGKVTNITFQYKTVNILFSAEKLSVEEFVEKFVKEYQLSGMEFKDMGIVKSWIYKNQELKIKISIDNNKNLRLQPLKK